MTWHKCGKLDCTNLLDTDFTSYCAPCFISLGPTNRWLKQMGHWKMAGDSRECRCCSWCQCCTAHCTNLTTLNNMYCYECINKQWDIFELSGAL
jgi:hypothetical protein